MLKLLGRKYFGTLFYSQMIGQVTKKDYWFFKNIYFNKILKLIKLISAFY